MSVSVEDLSRWKTERQCVFAGAASIASVARFCERRSTYSDSRKDFWPSTGAEISPQVR